MSQHVLLAASVFVVGSAVYNIVVTRRTTVELPTAVLMIASGAVSMAYVSFSNAASHSRSNALQVSTTGRVGPYQAIATFSLGLAVTLWLFCCATAVTFVLARHPSCSHEPTTGVSTIETGPSCIIQRSGIGASLLALLVSGLLFILMHKVHEPFRCHLLGVTRGSPLLPLMLPHKNSIQRPMYSEMSFKCRSSASLSSETLVASMTNSTTTLLPTKPEKVIGLGIYAPQPNTAIFLAPRPPLSSIHTYSKTRSVPPTSPLPPLPAYFPKKYRTASAMYKVVHPPRRPARPDEPRRQRTVRIVPPSPALFTANLTAYNKSSESLTSVYSRSISGEKRSPQSSAILTVGSRSYSSSSTVTVKKSPLDAMRLASDLEVVMMAKKSMSFSDGSDSDIDDAATLQARLPSVRAMYDIGDVHTWAGATSHPKKTQRSIPTTLDDWDGPILSRPRLVVRRVRPKRTLRQRVQVKEAISHGKAHTESGSEGI